MSKKSENTKLETLFQIYKDPERKSIYRIIKELFELTIFYKTIPRHYLTKYLFKADKTNIKDYFPKKILQNIKPYFNNQAVVHVVENKLYFDFYYSQFNIRLPEILMYNHKKMFVFGSLSVMIHNEIDFKNLLENVFEKNPLMSSLFIKKTYESFGGDNIYKLNKSQLTSNLEWIKELYFEVIEEGFLFQETVKQHSELNRLNPSCLNTIRFDTFIDIHNNIEIISGYIRMSINNSHVDNASSGGYAVGIDIESGVLKKEGYPKKLTDGVKLLTSHPITNVVFEDFSIPYFNEAKELVIRSSSFMPGLRLVGWDVAIGESGPVLIEGNSNYGMDGNDKTMGGYGSSAVFRKILSELPKLKNKIALSQS